MLMMLATVTAVTALTALIIVFFALNAWRGPQTGGSRTAIFSRFSYQPDFPFISRLDTVDPVRFSKVYNQAGPLKFIRGRPYQQYQSAASTWLYPWEFPNPIDYECIQLASQRCNEPAKVTVKSSSDKVKGLGITAPTDVVATSSCYNRWYSQCTQSKQKHAKIE